ncbi:uncharacterized protein LOC122078232 [Macadamia integrifolia]|uniref:uncharacterized protein LOC122078232 n=1 Tax=Macadamia integrifolia TaxID=60698 RepID=UPI001C4FB201|nr:uncharacterized protein LOC122078232 [Macadamia integrifolia]
MMDSMQNPFAAINTRLDNVTGSHDHAESSNNQQKRNGGGSNGRQNNTNTIGTAGTYLPKMVKLDFSKFNGSEDPTSWVCRADQFFEFHQTPDEEHVPLASFNLECDAQLWYQLMKNEQETISWAAFKEGLHVSGLKEGIKVDVQAAKPTTLSATIGLARLYEARNQSARKLSSSNESKKFMVNRSSDSNSTMPIKKLSPTELSERRAKGLCFNYNEKFSPAIVARSSSLLREIGQMMMMMLKMWKLRWGWRTKKKYHRFPFMQLRDLELLKQCESME